MPISVEADVLSSRADTVIDAAVLSNEVLTGMYRDMYLIRRVEESLLELAESGKIGGAMHTAIGHEASAVGSTAALNRTDYLTCTYRGHHHALARGHGPQVGDCRGAWARTDGFAKGKGGSMHFIEPPTGLMGGNGIVGAQVPHAAGMALAARIRGDDRIAITYFGDGALYQGVMHETFNMSSRWKLPIIFYCENNRYSEMTPISRTSSARDIYMFARAYGMNSVQIDGNDVEVVYQVVSDAAKRARAGEGPTFIEGITYRLAGHMAGDLETYRTPEEIEAQRAHEPMVVLTRKLLDRGVEESDVGEDPRRGGRRGGEAVEYAQNSPWPEQSEAYTDVFAIGPAKPQA